MTAKEVDERANTEAVHRVTTVCHVEGGFINYIDTIEALEEMTEEEMMEMEEEWEN